MLHGRLITMRWRLAHTPVYALLSEHGRHTIELAPQPAPAQATQSFNGDYADLDEDMMDISAPEARIASDTRVLLSVSISDDATCDIAEWKEWLTHKAPRIVTQIGVKVEAVFKSHSTMLVTSLPILAWDCLPDKAAYRFIGFIKSGNLDRTHPCSEEECQRLAATVSEQQRHLSEVEKQMQFLESEVMSTLEKMVKNRAATDVDELYKLRLQANQQLKALELMKKPRSIGGVEVGDSSTQGQPEDPLPETRNQRLSAVQVELNAEGSGIHTPDSSSDSLEQSTLGVIETTKQSANYAMSSAFKDEPLVYTEYAVQKHVSATQVKSQENDSPRKFESEVMTGDENAMASRINFSSKSLQGSTESSSQQSFDTLAVPYLGKANYFQKTFDRTLGPGSLKPESTATTSYVRTEQAVLRSNRKRPRVETDLSPPNSPREAPGLSLMLGRSISTVRHACQRCLRYQTDEILLDQNGRAPPVVGLWCKQCNYSVLASVITAAHGIQSITIRKPQEISSNYNRNRITQNNEEKNDTQPLLAQKLPLTFLIAVHNDYNRQLLFNQLSTLGYADVYEAYDGKEAVQMVARSHSTRGHGEKPINVVLIDPWLPTMNGYEATRNILALGRRERRGKFTSSHKPEDDDAAQTKPGVTVLAVSGDTSDAARKRAMAVGIRGYIIPTVIEHLDMVLLKYCTGHQIREGQENDLEPYASDTGFFDNESLYNFQRPWDSAIEPPPFGIGIRESDKSLKYSKGHLKATTTNVIPARPVTHAALAALREQETARGPSTLWGGTPAVSRLGQGPVLLDDWNESKLEELATAYMRSRENMWRILASKLGREWSTVEEKVSNLLASVEQVLLTKISQCFEKGVEELSKLSRKAQSRTHSFFHGDAESSFSNDKRTIASYTDSAIGMN